jgi:uncharacterized protein YgiM (DUF1202 family)
MKRIIPLIGLIFLTICSFGQMKVTSGDVNFRTTPEFKENKICVIPKGTVVTIVQDSIERESWVKINYNGKNGYVSKSFLKNYSSNSKKYDYSDSSDKEVKYYTNSKGKKVQSPTHYNSAPTGATAECNDGSYSFSRSRRGTCSHHGGVKRWLN